MALRSRRHGWLVLNVFRLIMVRSRLLGASTAAAIVGLVAITVYLVVERAVANRLPVVLCLQQLLQWDASNAYGPRAFSGGWPTALVGLAMDFVVSLAWAAVFTVLYWKIPTVRRVVVPAGIAFGAVVMVVMLYAIVPLGHAARMQSTASHVINVLVAHTLFFGLPLAVTVRSVTKRSRLELDRLNPSIQIARKGL